MKTPKSHRTTLTAQAATWLCGALVVVIGLADFMIGAGYATAVFYFVPITLASFYCSRVTTVLMVLGSSLAWFCAEYFALKGDSLAFEVILWNTLMRGLSFIAVAYMLHRIQDEHHKVHEAAYTDGLTGALNFRACHERLEDEVYRAYRNKQPVSFAIIDLDNFKSVNDQQGHGQGDRLLESIAHHIRSNIRKSDFLARVGGDEFALFLGNTTELEANRIVAKLKNELLSIMEAESWPVTFSIGLVTFNRRPDSIPEMIRIADQAMYVIKNESKNGIHHICLG